MRGQLVADPMASTDGGGDEFGDSLFEGMVLFSPSDLSQSPPEEPSLPPPAPPLPPVSQPLDEDLFSDLILQTPIQPPDPPPPPAAQPPPPSRQISRKKKRAVRIGYGRDAAPEDPPPPLPASFSPPSPPSSGEEDAAPRIPEEPPRRRFDIAANSLPDPTPEQPGTSPELPHQSIEEQRQDGSPSLVLEESNMEKTIEPEAPAATVAHGKEDAFGSIDEKLKLVKDRIYEKFERIREMAASASAERKELGRRRRKAAEDVAQASARHRELEKELEEACETEDFERAERVSESLAAAEKEKDGLLNVLREAELECDAMDSKMQEILEQQIAAEEESAAMLEQFAKDAADHADLVLKNAEEISARELEEWQSSMELLEIKKLEMETESQVIFEARSGLEHSIEHLIEDDKIEKEKLTRKRDELAKELNELLELVRLKEAEIGENDSKIQEIEERISDVVSEFHETQSSIDMKHENLLSTLSKIELEGETLLMKKKEMDDFISLVQKKSSQLGELANVSLDDARACQDLVGFRKSLASSNLKSREDKVRLAKTEEKILEDIQTLRQQISTSRATLQELSSTRASIQQEIASLKQRVDFIDKRGPELEAEKKVAAAARNFKEAGRIAAEAKALNLEKESLQNKKEKAISDLEKLEEEIKDTLDNIQENEGLILSKEKEAALAGCKRLRLVAAAARAERSAALELGDTEEGDILLDEVEAAECKARELQEAYDLELEDENNFEHLVSIELITNLAGQRLAELASSFHLPSDSGSHM